MFKTYKDWISENEHKQLLAEVIYAPKWRFGQTSDSNIEPNYPCWFQNFYTHQNWDFKKDCPELVKTLADRFLDMVPDDYMLVRCMASSNTFGIDGDFHTDWPVPEQSITGVLYTDKEWDEIPVTINSHLYFLPRSTKLTVGTAARTENHAMFPILLLPSSFQ